VLQESTLMTRNVSRRTAFHINMRNHVLSSKSGVTLSCFIIKVRGGAILPATGIYQNIIRMVGKTFAP